MHQAFKNTVVRCSLTMCLGVLSVQNLTAQFVEISAEIQTYGYRLKDTNSIAAAKPETVRVACIAGANTWYIDENFHGRTEWLFNGTNVIARSGPESFQRSVLASQDGHPFGDAGVNIPWLAFCSGNYLKSEGRMIPLPAAVLRHCPDRFAYTDNTTTFPDQLGLPRTVDLFSSQAQFLKAHTDWDKELEFGDRYTDWNHKTAAKIQDGLLVFHYAVLQSTNVLGRSFPTEFEFFQIGRPYEENGNWFCHGVGHVKSIRASTKAPSLK